MGAPFKFTISPFSSDICISIEDIDMSQFHDIKAVFHLAAQASVHLSIKNFYQTAPEK